MIYRPAWRRCFPRRLSPKTVVAWKSTAASPASRAHNAPLRMAVIGSGPAGFYAAYRVMSKVPNVHVDMYESLPVPFGLVRHGVAPDHPEVKNCQDKFEEIASAPNFTFLGNVSVGRPSHKGDHLVVDLESLTQNYNSILFCYGASEDKRLGVPGESTLSGIYSAREFVGWYNGLTDCAGLAPDLTRGEEAVIIGQGNVALDCARMLLEDIDVLKKTDISEHALAELAESKVKRVRIVARRGPMQAAFTIKEVRELMKLQDVGFHPVERSLIPEDVKKLPRASKRLMEVILKGSSTPPCETVRSWSLDSCLSPLRFLGHEQRPTNVASTEFQVTQLQSPHDPKSRVSNTEETRIIPSDLVFRSIGYKSTALPGFTEAGIQFDEGRGILPNDGLGRVTRLLSNYSAQHVANELVPGMYCAGWVKRGPTGVIASTMEDAFATGDAIASDWLSGVPFLGGEQRQAASGWDGVKEAVGPNHSNIVSWDQWRKIDEAEKENGRKAGKEREKFKSTDEMLAVIG